MSCFMSLMWIFGWTVAQPCSIFWPSGCCCLKIQFHIFPAPFQERLRWISRFLFPTCFLAHEWGFHASPQDSLNTYEVRLELHRTTVPEVTVRLLELYHPKRICSIFQPSIFRCLSSMLSQWPMTWENMLTQIWFGWMDFCRDFWW